MMRHSSSSSSSSSLVFKQLLTSNPFRSSSSRRFLSVVGTQHHFNTLNSYLHHNNNNNKNNNNNNNANQGWRNYEKQALFLATGSAIGFLSARAFFHSDSVIHAAAPESTEETIEAVVGQTSDLKDGEMKPVAVGDQKFLLSRVKGQYYVTDLKCTHYGVPLHFGVISGDRIVCGAHGAAFSLKTGQVETSPGLDPLNTYPVRIEGPNIITTVPKIPRPVNLKKGKCCCKDSRVFVIIGGGPAGLMAAETARADGFKGKIILVTREQNLPYDRPSLSKGLGSPISKLLLRQEDFFSANSIDVQRGKKLVSVDRNSKSLTFDDGTKLNYNFVLFATGADPRELSVSGSDSEGIYTLRSFSDHNLISEAAKNAKSVVVVGSGFIGMEMAASLKKNFKDLDVTVIGPEKVAFQRILGPEVGAVLQNLSESNGVRFRMQHSVSKFNSGPNHKVQSVVLDNGEVLPADLVIVGAGVIPATANLKSGVPLNKDGSVNVTNTNRIILEDGAESVDMFAAGDIATFPYNGHPIRIEHWNVAQTHGRTVGHNIAGVSAENSASVPFFWTRSWDESLQYVGHTTRYDEVIIQGDLSARKFVAFYILDQKPVAVAVMGMGKAGVAAAELFRLGKFPSLETIRKTQVDLTEILKSLQ